jgi:hypothetical protein
MREINYRRGLLKPSRLMLREEKNGQRKRAQNDKAIPLHEPWNDPFQHNTKPSFQPKLCSPSF